MTCTIIGVCTSFTLSMFPILLFVGDIAFSFSTHVLPLNIIGGDVGSISFLVQWSEPCIQNFILCTRWLQWLDTYAFWWDGSFTIWKLFHSYFWKPWRYLPSSIDQLFRLSLLYLVMFYIVGVLQISSLIVFANSCFFMIIFCSYLLRHSLVWRLPLSFTSSF